MIAKNIEGKVFYNLTVIRRVGTNANRYALWECLCSCGENTVTTGKNLRSGHTKSCGCLKRQLYPKHVVKHGMFGTKPYKTWAGIKYRCENPNSKAYKYYGARGIQMNKGWSNSFKDFYEYVGDPPSDKHSLDRIDNNGNYEPGNVRWATSKQQANNRRNNRLYDYKGISMSIAEWSKYRNINYNTLSSRLLKYKQPLEKALEYE